MPSYRSEPPIERTCVVPQDKCVQSGAEDIGKPGVQIVGDEAGGRGGGGIGRVSGQLTFSGMQIKGRTSVVPLDPWRYTTVISFPFSTFNGNTEFQKLIAIMHCCWSCVWQRSTTSV